jgi:FkbM family methyltransferase
VTRIAQVGRRLSSRAARSVATRTGRHEQLAELEAVFDRARRRELRDELVTGAILAATLRRGSNVIDVGANVGAVLEQVVRLADAGTHIAYEPVPELAADLRARFPGVDVREAALSDEAGDAEFTVVVDRPSYSGLVERRDIPASAAGRRRIKVALERLDDVLPEGYAPDLIKIDVEGAEVRVLQGARRTLEAHRPTLLFEHGAGGADLYCTTSTQLWELLSGCGLRIFDLEGGGPFSREEFERLFDKPVWNYVAVAAD